MLRLSGQKLLILESEYGPRPALRTSGHLRRIERGGRVADILGLATSWLAPNPVSVGLLAFAMMARFVTEHKVLHGGCDNIADAPPRRTWAVHTQDLRNTKLTVDRIELSRCVSP